MKWSAEDQLTLSCLPVSNCAVVPHVPKKQRKSQGFSVWSKTDDVLGSTFFSSSKVARNKDKQLLICPQCFYNTYVPQRMKNHEKMHTSGFSFVCSYCKCGFVNKGALGKHLVSCRNIRVKNSKKGKKK